MRQVHLQVPRDVAAEVTTTAEELGATTLTRVPGGDGRGHDVELLVLTMPNAAVGPLLEQARRAGSVEACVPAGGAFAFEPPAGEVSEELLDVSRRSALEVVLAGRQAVGGWPDFLVFAFAAAVVAWLGLTTGTIYLLTGSMLIAPFAGPAMNTAIAIASGRRGLLGHALARYVVGIAATAATSAGLTLLLGPPQVPGLMLSVLTLTTTAILLPLVAGVAGATFLVSSEHSSLISGAAVGVLVAASLAPPASGLGIAFALGRGDLVADAVFVVALQLAGITATAVVSLWLYGVRADGGLAAGSDRWLTAVGLVVAAAAITTLLGLQLGGDPTFRRGSQVQTAVTSVGQVVDALPDVTLLDVSVSLGSTDATPPRLLVNIVVEAPAAVDPAEVRRELAAAVSAQLERELTAVAPRIMVDVVTVP